MFPRLRINPNTAIALLALSGLFLSGCLIRGNHSAKVSEELSTTQTTIQQDGKVAVDAYLFDVKVRHKGHLRSMRLHIFFADTMALITARGYLGKGAGKGIWRADSSLFYFPSQNEFYSGPLDKLTTLDCIDAGNLQNAFAEIFSANPERVENIAGLSISKRSEKRIKATLSLGDCKTQLTLLFDSPKKDGRFYLSEMSYHPDGAKEQFRAKRRTLKAQSAYELRKFDLHIPADAQSVSLD